MNKPFPLTVAERAAPDPLRNWYRRATALAMCGIGGARHLDEAMARMWPEERASHDLILRGAVSPTTTTSAAPLVSTGVVEFLTSLRPRSAAAQLFASALNVDLQGVGQVAVPRFNAFPDPVFVGEGAPAPVGLGPTGSATIGPARKMMMLAGVTGELATYSAPSAEAIIRFVMNDTAAHALDAAVLSAAAASDVRPAGLLNGVTPITAAPLDGAGGDHVSAMAKDLGILAAAISANGGGANIVFLMPPRQAVALAIYAPAFRYPVIDAPSLPDGTVVAVEAGALATGFSALPTIDLSKEALLHWDDAAPQPIALPGSPNVVSAPVRSAFQSDLIALRMILPCAWASMLAGGVQYVTGVNW